MRNVHAGTHGRDSEQKRGEIGFGQLPRLDNGYQPLNGGAVKNVTFNEDLAINKMASVCDSTNMIFSQNQSEFTTIL
jgi:hypothetical protein